MLNKKVADVAKILEAMQTVNHHVKDLQKLANYLQCCEVADKKNCYLDFSDFPEDQRQPLKRLLAYDINLSYVAMEHYQVALQAYKNWNFGFYLNMSLKFKHPDDIPKESPYILAHQVTPDMDAGCLVETSDFIVTYGKDVTMNKHFSLPDIKCLTAFKNLVEADITMLYSLKDAFIRVALSDDDDQIKGTVIGRQEDSFGRQYVSVCVNDRFRYHYPSDELFRSYPDLDIEKYSGGSSESKVFGFSKDAVNDAVDTLRRFFSEER